MVVETATHSILLVESDDGFVEGARDLLEGHKVYTARNITDAQRRLVEESIDLGIMGPTYAHEAGVAEASLLFDVRPDLPVVLVAEVVTIDVLRAALRTGVKDVVEAPLTISKMEEALGIVAAAGG